MGPMSVLSRNALLIALAGGISGCAVPAELAPRSAPGRPHVRVVCAPARGPSIQGEEVRTTVWVTNDGDWPVVLLRAEADRPGDESVSFLDEVPGRIVYDGERDKVLLEPPLLPRDRVMLVRGLVLPGEAIRAETTIVPLLSPVSVHAFRLAYFAAPWPVLREKLYIAPYEGQAGPRCFSRFEPMPYDPDRPRVRTAILADGNGSLDRYTLDFEVRVTLVEPAPLPIEEARTRARVGSRAPAFWSRFAGGWAFEVPGGVVVAGFRSEQPDVVRYPAMRLSALRAIETVLQDDGPAPRLPVIFSENAPLGRLLAELPVLEVPTPGGDPRRAGFVALESLPAFLEEVGRAGLAVEGIHTTRGRALFVHP